MPTPIFEQLTAEHGFDPLEGIEWEELRAVGYREPVARARVSPSGPSIHDLPRYRARYGVYWGMWHVEKLHYMTEHIANYQVYRMFHSESAATKWADTMNRSE
ncbi:hypothetical protein [Arthrobacter rhombi]|uniref:hypothetical protein n=1 Tax=Arthrobacter rhombi TaxID=71253 RepID=UPI003FCF8204